MKFSKEQSESVMTELKKQKDLAVKKINLINSQIKKSSNLYNLYEDRYIKLAKEVRFVNFLIKLECDYDSSLSSFCSYLIKKLDSDLTKSSQSDLAGQSAVNDLIKIIYNHS